MKHVYRVTFQKYTGAVTEITKNVLAYSMADVLVKVRGIPTRVAKIEDLGEVDFD